MKHAWWFGNLYAGTLAKQCLKTELVSILRNRMKLLETGTSLVNGLISPHHSLNLPVVDTI